MYIFSKVLLFYFYFGLLLLGFLNLGKEFCSWEEERKNYTKVYDNSVSLFKEVECLFGTLPDEDGPKVFLPVGKTTYPFEFLLPSQLPSSFEGKHGHIRYKLRGILTNTIFLFFSAKI